MRVSSRGGDKNAVFIVVESRFQSRILYSNNIVYLQIDWFIGYHGIVIEL